MAAKGVHFRADIQGLRGVAILLVVAFHAGTPIRGGFVGVDVFFVVSGFVITRLLLADLMETGRVDCAHFYGRRIRRLLPALALMLVTVTLACLALGPVGSLQLTARTAAAAALISANVFLYRWGIGGYFDEPSESNPLIHAWSLSLEEQFYLFFPTLLVIGWWLGRSVRRSPRKTATVLVLLTCAASLGLSVVMTGGGGPRRIADPRSFAFYLPLTRAWEFGAGALIPLISTGAVLGSSIARRSASICGILLIGGASLTYGPTTLFPGLAALAAVVGTALLIASGGRDDQTPWVARALQGPVLGWLGDLSYSWYLWHWPFIVLGRTLFPAHPGIPVMMALLSLLPAWWSYVAVETPLRSWAPPSARRTATLALACTSLGLLGAIVLESVSRALHKVESIAAVTRHHLDVTAGCHNDTPLGLRPAGTCTWSQPTPHGRIVLIGDSNAGHFTEPVVRAAVSLGYSVEVATISACPFVDVVVRRQGTEQARCRGFFEASMKALVAKPPTLVIIASASDRYIRQKHVALAKPGGGEWQQFPEAKERLWALQLEATLRSLHNAGSRLLVVHPIPKLPPWRAGSCAVALEALWPQACGISQSLDEAILYRKPALDAERASALATGTDTLDLSSDICPDSTCHAWRDGVWWYRDGGHLGIQGALALTPRFHQALAEVLGDQ